MSNQNGKQNSNFKTISQDDLPAGRRGKHHSMLLKVLEDLDQLDNGKAIRIPLGEYPGSVADIRSAIHRAVSKQKVEIATSSDEKFFYVWKPGS